MKKIRYSLLCAGLAVTAAGCSIPANSSFETLAQHRPAVMPHRNVLPAAPMLQHPGPGVDGPGPGVMLTGHHTAIGGGGVGGPCGPDGAIGGIGGAAYAPTSQIGFIGMDGMKVAWDVSGPGQFDSEPMVFPGVYNFTQGAIYRLKLTDVPGEKRAGMELYPTIEIAPATPRTDAFLAHNYIPFQLTNEDFDQVASGNFVTKVIYLPDAEHQELAVAGVETLVSTRLDPGLDPIVEADRKGSILMIIRMGNKDLQAAGGAGAGVLTQAGYNGEGGGCGPGGGLPQYMAGVTAPSYGMPITGTPIGLPGPPHIPLGAPAGLQKHVIKNNTHMHIPTPVEKFNINVKQKPGLSYPKPVSKVNIVERSHGPLLPYGQPHSNRHQVLPGAGDYGNYGPGGACSTSDCEPGAE